MTVPEICRDCIHLGVCKWADMKHIEEEVDLQLDGMFTFEIKLTECVERFEVVQ